EALALLAGRLGEHLLDPEAELTGIRVDADLVAGVAPVVPEREAELEAGVVVALRAARLDGLLGTGEERLELETHERRRDHAERRERRVAAADLGVPCEDAPKA